MIEISKSISMEVSDMGLVYTFFFTGFVLGSFLGGVLSKYFSKYVILNTSLILQTIFIIVFSFSNNYIFALLSSFAIGTSGGLSEIMACTMLAELNKGREGYYMNISQMFFGIGAFIGPYISSTIIKIGLNWNIVYYIVAFLTLTNFVFFCITSLNYRLKIVTAIEIKSHENTMKTNNTLGWTPAMISILFISAFAMLMYTASEDGLNAWGPTFFRIERGLNLLEAGQVLSFYWLAIAVGRLIVGVLSEKINLLKLTIIISILGLIFVLAGLFVQNKYLNITFFLLAGFFYSGIWPNIVALTSEYFTTNKEIAMSTVISSGGLGSLLAPLIVGIIYKNSSLFIGLVACVVFLFLEILLMLILSMFTAKNKLILNKAT
ncbi:MAG: MFS transporter [Actinobacteria bacterium]|nr:MFS transporter [Actinomycetota bacterium]